MSLLDSLGLTDSKKAPQPHAEFLAVISDEQNAATMRAFLSHRMQPNALVMRGKVAHAIAFLRRAERPPAQLLVDVSDVDAPLSVLAQLAEVCDPSIEVYVLGSKNDVGLYRNLLQLGVRDYLVKPLTSDLLTATLGDASSPSAAEALQRARTGKVLSFVGARGGVGVSTVCTHLARHLAEVMQRRVALIDLNLYGGAVNVILGQQTNQGLVDVLQNVHHLDQAYLERTMVRASARLFVLSGELDYQDRFAIPEGHLADLLKLLKQHFHYVLIDASRPGAGLPQLTEEALDQSREVYLMADRTVHAARMVTRLTRHVLARESEPAVSVLLNQTGPTNAAMVSVEDFGRATQRPVALELPFDASNLTLSQNLGEPVKPQSPFGKAIARLADSLSGVQQKAESAQLWGGGTKVRRMVR
ncbi:AAA family ATPase [Paludibacterium purpuratum]|uniref:Pilus assembly protein CpaE n=1 Tax=Paludibacterium purpuratum TaxID=1144873 RepID=A0A4R7B981_9NEIS|nr:AAA family ATPase [Paludibacterium purpuratum]TDR80246.1 pilus assembly protein CpaE [Paludibacterium purpuratum]